MGSKRRREPPDDELGANFAAQLQLMIEDPTSKGIAQWCADNKSFAIYSPQRFEDGLLRKYFSELDLQAFFGKLREHGFEVQRETVWVALHPSHVKNTNKLTGEVTELLQETVAESFSSSSSLALALPAAVQTQITSLPGIIGLSGDPQVLAVLGKMIEHQAAMLQTIQRMEKEVEQTRAHQMALATILESLSEPNTPAISMGEPAVSGGGSGMVALADGTGSGDRDLL